ncbi:MAG: hypothetical protein R3C09_02760 [Pirellulaceae bacterium]
MANIEERNEALRIYAISREIAIDDSNALGVGRDDAVWIISRETAVGFFRPQ